jgi:hypothetical protein
MFACRRWVLYGWVAICLPVSAQTITRRAVVRDDGRREGKCTVEVVVDERAEVEIRGDSAMLRNISGNPPEWRRFQCNAAMPAVPLNFTFKGIDGRGSQRLIRNPSDGGPAIIQIEDTKGGKEGYTFDVMWNGAGDPRRVNGGFGGPTDNNFNRDRGFGARTGFDRAMRDCEEAIIDQALDRLRPQAVVIRRTAMDDDLGRGDWIVGNFEVRRGRDWDRYRFQCSYNFVTGRVNSADFETAGRR